MRTLLLAASSLGLLASAATAAPTPRSASAEVPAATADRAPVLLALKAAPTLEQRRAAPRRGRPVLLALKAPPM